jgi:hypothetical protein
MTTRREPRFRLTECEVDHTGTKYGQIARFFPNEPPFALSPLRQGSDGDLPGHPSSRANCDDEHRHGMGISATVTGGDDAGSCSHVASDPNCSLAAMRACRQEYNGQGPAVPVAAKAAGENRGLSRVTVGKLLQFWYDLQQFAVLIFISSIQ